MVIAERKNSLTMLVLLGMLVFVYHFANGFYFAEGIEPLPTVEFLYTTGFLCGVVWWLQAEAKQSPVKSVHCHGLLVGIGWFFIIPYHLLKTRGLRGILPLLALIGTFLFAYVLAGVVHLAFGN